MKDWDKIDISGIHLPIMQLAEIFLAYNSATSSNLDNPDVIFVFSCPLPRRSTNCFMLTPNSAIEKSFKQ